MWVSRQVVNNKDENSIEIGYISNAEYNNITIQNNQEYRNIPIVAPFGIAYVPPVGKDAVVIPTSGETVCAGVICEEKNLEPGEIMLYSSGGASIILKNNGKVLINGAEF